MPKLSIKETRKTKEYLEGQPERHFFGATGLTLIEIDLFDTIEAQHREIKQLKLEKDIYDRFVRDLCKALLENVNEKNICEMTVSKENVTELIESLPRLN